MKQYFTMQLSLNVGLFLRCYKQPTFMTTIEMLFHLLIVVLNWSQPSTYSMLTLRCSYLLVLTKAKILPSSQLGWSKHVLLGLIQKYGLLVFISWWIRCIIIGLWVIHQKKSMYVYNCKKLIMTLLNLCAELNVQLKEPRNFLDLCVEFKNLKPLCMCFYIFLFVAYLIPTPHRRYQWWKIVV